MEAFWYGGFSENGFNSILILGLSFLRVVGAYNIYTDFVPWQVVLYYHLFYLALYIDLCRYITSLSDGIIFT